MGDSDLSSEAARSELYRLMETDEGFETKAERALELGEEYLGAENGHITRIDPENDYWRTLFSTDPPEGQFPPGLVLDLGTTYCRLTLDRTGSMALHDASEQGLADDPAYETHGIHCYHGTTLTLGDDTYGTVCFVAEDPREQPFSTDETMFAELISRLLERELERMRAARETERLDEFADVISHDVQTPLNVAQSAVGVTTRRYDDDEELAKTADALDRIERLIESMVTVARQGRAVTQTETVTLWSVAQQCWQRVATDGATIDIERSGQFSADRERMQHLFENLFRNAVEHGGADVTVRVGELNDGDGFYVADDGPGIPADERTDVFDTGYTTSQNGVGLGLVIVERVADAHDWTIDVTDSADGGARFEIANVVVPQ